MSKESCSTTVALPDSPARTKTYFHEGAYLADAETARLYGSLSGVHRETPQSLVGLTIDQGNS